MSAIKTLTEKDFVKRYLSNSPQIMWFIGAGFPRSAGMPNAGDIIWDLKKRYYCLEENQQFLKHDLHNQAIKIRIQSYMDAKQHPQLGSTEEYSFYFQLLFKDNYPEQQQYMQEQLAEEKISLNIGHRVLAGLLSLGNVKCIFTTNFDKVIETAYSEVTGKELDVFHLEGSYAALDALNSEKYPFYAKLHGDFRYQSIKNLADDLKNNDDQIAKALINACSRYGLVVIGYSGRDNNVMQMFHEALQDSNAFPKGFYWCILKNETISPAIEQLLSDAQCKGIETGIVEIGTADTLLAKIWNQIEHTSDGLDAKIRGLSAREVSISMPESGTEYPLLRMNALPVVEVPTECLQVICDKELNAFEVKILPQEKEADTIMCKLNGILAWGTQAQIKKTLQDIEIRETNAFNLSQQSSDLANHMTLRSFYEHALAYALSKDIPLDIRYRNHRYYLVIKGSKKNDEIFTRMRKVLGYNGQLGWLSGRVKGVEQATWIEALSFHLEQKEGKTWLFLRPDFWVSPSGSRQEAAEFLRQKRIYRRNQQSDALLGAWIDLILPTNSRGNEITLTAFGEGSDNNPVFVINTRTAFSLRSTSNV